MEASDQERLRSFVGERSEDRDALVLRFLDNRQFHALGTELGISEEAARRRMSRALEKLRDIFGKRGILPSTGLLRSTDLGVGVHLDSTMRPGTDPRLRHVAFRAVFRAAGSMSDLHARLFFLF